MVEQYAPRRLSAQFLLDLITVPEFANAVPRRGIRIFGAWFVEGIDLAAVEFNKELWFNDSRFDGEFHMRYAKVANLSVEGSTFEQKVDLENAQFETHLLMSANATFNGYVHLFGVRVGGNLLADSSTFNANLSLNSSRISINMLLRNEATFRGEVNISGAHIGGVLDIEKTLFEQRVYVFGVNIDRNLNTIGSTFNSDLFLNFTRISGALQLGNSASWPRQGALHVDGLIYSRVASDEPTPTYGEWLARDPTASPQPYQHLATVFREAGAYDKANEILYAGRERARSEAEGLRWIWLTLLKITIGYGIGAGYFRALILAGILTVVGMLILKTSHAEVEGRSWLWCFWASLDEILPVVSLDEAHARFINMHLSSWRLSYFYIHRIVAFVLGSFVVAGLAGLTQGP